MYLRDTLTLCGPGKTILNTWRTLDRSRFDLMIAATRPSPHQRNALLDALERAGARTVELAIGRGVDLVALSKLVRLMRLRNVDILQSHDAQSRRLGAIAAALTGVPHVTSVHGWIFNNAKQKVARWLDMRVIRLATHVIAVSHCLKRQLEGAGVPSDRIAVLRNAVLLEDYPRDHSGRSLRTEFGIPGHHAVVAVVGRLSLEKGHDTFLRSARQILNALPNTTFLVVGDGPQRSSLEQLATQLDLGSHVIFTGHRSAMSDIYATIDLLMISSLTEGVPNVLLEAFAHGKPAVATDVGGVREVLDDGKTGWLVDPGHAGQLAARTIQMLTNPQQLEQMGAAARTVIEEHFSFGHRTRAVERLYETLARPSASRHGPRPAATR
jgi:glycosyltransferase involved in cell wall biosynthesis